MLQGNENARFADFWIHNETGIIATKIKVLYALVWSVHEHIKSIMPNNLPARFGSPRLSRSTTS